MKKQFRILTTFLTLTLLLSISSVSIAQPPPPGGGHGGTGNEPPAGAPVGEGMFLLISLAGLYGGKKTYDFRKALNNEK